MAERLAKISEYGEYKAYHYTAAQSDAALDSATHGHFVGYILVGKLGTGLTITLGNGTTNTAANVITSFVPSATGTYPVQCVCDSGLYLALAGTGFDVTIIANDMAV